jgi:hypothetical protein
LPVLGAPLQTLNSAYNFGGVSGTLTSQVYNNAGLLDFTYQFDLSSASGPNAFVLGLDLFSFGSFTTSVASIDAFGGPLDVDPNSANRSAVASLSGTNRVSFIFNAPAVDQANPFSEILFVRTNAPATGARFVTTSQVVTSSGNANVATLAPVPEPTTALVGVALCGFIASTRRRRQATKA